MGSDNEWRAKMVIRNGSKRVNVVMKDGDINVIPKGIEGGEALKVPLADADAFEKTARRVLEMLS